MDYRFKRRESVRAGFRRIASELCDAFRTHLAGADAPDIHEARKTGKMLRALLRLGRGAIDPAEFTAIDHAVRDISRQLGPARDAEVRRRSFQRLLTTHPDCDPQTFATITRVLNAQARTARRRALSAAVLARRVREIDALCERLSAVELKERGWAAIERGLRRTYAQARRPLRADSALTDEARHAWRKHVKTLWYHTRLLAGIRKRKMSSLTDDLDTLGELFGEERDLAMLAAHLRGRLLRGAPPRVCEPLFALIDDSRAELFGVTRNEAAKLLDEKPRAFTHRIEAWWRAWHA